MKKFTLLIACIFFVSCAGCIPFKRVNKISKMELSDLNIRAIDKDIFNNCTLYRMDESVGVSGYDRDLYKDGDGNYYFYYDSYCEAPFRIRVITQKKSIEVKPISNAIKAEDIENNAKVPLVYLKDPDLKAFSADEAILLNARVINRHHQKKCDAGIGDIEFELIDAKNIFYLLSILNKDDKEEILSRISDEKLTTLIENNFEDVEDIVKIAKSNARVKEKLYQTTMNSEKIKNTLRSMSDSARKEFIKKIDSPEYLSIVTSVLRGL